MSTDGSPKLMSGAAVLKNYFGLKDGQTLSDFTKELKDLTPADKKELATAAAKELGVALKD